MIRRSGSARVVSAVERRFLAELETFLCGGLPTELIVAQLFHAAIVVCLHCGMCKVDILKHVGLAINEAENAVRSMKPASKVN